MIYDLRFTISNADAMRLEKSSIINHQS